MSIKTSYSGLSASLQIVMICLLSINVKQWAVGETRLHPCHFNATLGESPTRLEVSLPTPHIDRGFHRFHLFCSWALAVDYLSNPEFSRTWRLVQDQLSLTDIAFRWGLPVLPDCRRCDLGLEETALHTFYHCPRVRPLWDHVSELTARIACAH